MRIKNYDKLNVAQIASWVAVQVRRGRNRVRRIDKSTKINKRTRQLNHLTHCNHQSPKIINLKIKSKEKLGKIPERTKVSIKCYVKAISMNQPIQCRCVRKEIGKNKNNKINYEKNYILYRYAEERTKQL